MESHKDAPHRGYRAIRLPFLEPIADRVATLHVTYFSITDQSPAHLSRFLSRASRLKSLTIYASHRIGNENRTWVSNHLAHWDFTGYSGASNTNRLQLEYPPPAPLKLQQLSLYNLCACAPGPRNQWETLVAWGSLQDATFSCLSIIELAGLHSLDNLKSLRYLPCDRTHVEPPLFDPVSCSKHKMWLDSTVLQSMPYGLTDLTLYSLPKSFRLVFLSHFQALKRLEIKWSRSLYALSQLQSLRMLGNSLRVKQTTHPNLNEFVMHLPFRGFEPNLVSLSLTM